MMRTALPLTLALLSAACGPQKPAAAPPAYFRVDPADAAGLRGTVRFTGSHPPAKRISMDAEEACQALHQKPVYDRPVESGKNGALSNVFVYIKSGLEGKTFAPPTETVVLEQKGCQFIPPVIALRAGQTLAVKNSDPVSHNIHPQPKNNRDWNQQQPPQSPDLKRRFAYPEVMIPVKCNVHAWMKSYIGVLDHPFFAVTGPTGDFSFEGLPPGNYTVAAWHEHFGETTQSVTLHPRQSATVQFVFP